MKLRESNNLTAGSIPANPSSGFLRQTFSTDPVPRKDRFERWRAEHDTLDISVRTSSDAMAFEGEREVLVSRTGQALSRSRYSANEVRFGREGRDLVILSVTTSGAVTVNNGSTSTLVQKGGLALIQADSRVSTSVGAGGHGHIYLAMSRDRAVEALRADVLRKGDAVRQLDHSPLAPFIAAQLQTLSGNGSELPAEAATVVLSSLEDMIFAALRQAGTDQTRRPDAADRHLYEAALAYMRRSFDDPDLTSTTIAAALGCSRTHLYDVFSLFGQTVAGALRTLRLTQARRMLETSRKRSAEIARAVGYRNESAFSRAFRETSGISPQAYRMRGSTGDC